MEEPVGCCGMATVMSGWTAVVSRQCSTTVLVKMEVAGGSHIQRGDLQRRPDLAMLSEKRASMHDYGRQRARHWT